MNVFKTPIFITVFAVLANFIKLPSDISAFTCNEIIYGMLKLTFEKSKTTVGDPLSFGNTISKSVQIKKNIKIYI